MRLTMRRASSMLCCFCMELHTSITSSAILMYLKIHLDTFSSVSIFQSHPLQHIPSVLPHSAMHQRCWHATSAITVPISAVLPLLAHQSDRSIFCATGSRYPNLHPWSPSVLSKRSMAISCSLAEGTICMSTRRLPIPGQRCLLSSRLTLVCSTQSQNHRKSYGGLFLQRTRPFICSLIMSWYVAR